MASRRARPGPRADLVARTHDAGRAVGTAAVLFHTALSARQGLSLVEEKTLDLLDRFGPLTAGEVARRTGLAPASVTGLVSRLEQKGFARRVADPEDGRRVLLEVDPAGVQRFAPLFADFVAQLEAMYEDYTDDELEVVIRFMTEAARRQQDATERLAAADDDRAAPAAAARRGRARSRR